MSVQRRIMESALQGRGATEERTSYVLIRMKTMKAAAGVDRNQVGLAQRQAEMR